MEEDDAELGLDEATSTVGEEVDEAYLSAEDDAQPQPPGTPPLQDDEELLLTVSAFDDVD